MRLRMLFEAIEWEIWSYEEAAHIFENHPKGAEIDEFYEFCQDVEKELS